MAVLKHCFEHCRQAAVRAIAPRPDSCFFFSKAGKTRSFLLPTMHHFPAVAARFRRRLGSQLKGSVVTHHNIMEPYRRRRRCLSSSPTTSSVPPASKPASHALPCPLARRRASMAVGRDGVRRPAAERCVGLTQVVRQLQHTHPLSSQKEKACRIVTNHHQIDSSPRRVSRFTSIRDVSQILKRTVFHQS